VSAIALLLSVFRILRGRRAGVEPAPPFNASLDALTRSHLYRRCCPIYTVRKRKCQVGCAGQVIVARDERGCTGDARETRTWVINRKAKGRRQLGCLRNNFRLARYSGTIPIGPPVNCEEVTST